MTAVAVLQPAVSLETWDALAGSLVVGIIVSCLFGLAVMVWQDRRDRTDDPR